MNRTKFVLVLGLLLGLCAASLGAADPPKSTANWDNLKALAPGDDVRVVLNDKKSYRGKFQSLTDNGIVVRVEKNDQSFERTNILRVTAKGQSHRLRNALVGAVLAAGVTAVVGAASQEQQAYVLALGVPGMAASGAVVGAVIPSGGWHDVYRAR